MCGVTPPEGPGGIRADVLGCKAPGSAAVCRVEAVSLNAPRHLDGDGLTDVFELAYPAGRTFPLTMPENVRTEIHARTR